MSPNSFDADGFRFDEWADNERDEALEEAEENGEGWGYLDEKHLEDWLESEEEKWMEDADERFPDWYYDKHYPDWKSSLYEEWLEEEAS